MTWNETRRRQAVIREVEAIASKRMDGILPWSEAYSEAYAGPHELLRDLAYFWRIAQEAQLDVNLDEVMLTERQRDLRARYAGVALILAQRDSEAARKHELAA